VTVMKANAEEATAFTGEPEPGPAAAALVGLGPAQAVVTAGSEGAFLAGRGGVVHVPAIDTDVVDATGAGDAVAAVVAAGLARRGALTPAVAQVAVQVAAGVVAARGAFDGLPARDEAIAMLER
jgi:sugar/nucleoside kinase (ribokinase family)